MKRIQDYYCWEKLWQWKYALDTKNLIGVNSGQTQLSEEELGKTICLLLHDMFPIAIICYRGSEGPTALMTSVFEGIFLFLQGKRYALLAGSRISFDNMASDEKSKILNAKILSIWIER